MKSNGNVTKGVKKMKPFDLERALAGDPVVTRDGREIGEIYWFRNPEIRSPVFAEIKTYNDVYRYSKDGKFATYETANDLFMAPKITSRWINIYKGMSGIIYSGSKLHESQELAINHAKMECPYLVTTIFVEIEE